MRKKREQTLTPHRQLLTNEINMPDILSVCVFWVRVCVKIP